MSEHQMTFIEKIQRTPNVFSFRFNIEPPITFIAGQFAQIIFDTHNITNKTLNKYLSFSNTPGNPFIEFTKKISGSEFSQKLIGLKAGDCISIKGPLGNCFLHDKDSKVLFLVGGIGITPVMSILGQIVEEKSRADIVLVYSNWTATDIAFRRELEEWGQAIPFLRLCHVLVEPPPDDREYSSGMITKDLVMEKAPDFKQRAIYIFGPPGMVKAMQEMCAGLDCDTQKIYSEKFLGY